VYINCFVVQEGDNCIKRISNLPIQKMIKNFLKSNIIANFDNRIFFVFMIRAGGAVFSLIASLIVTRALGATEYGIVAYALSWMSILSIPAKLGTDSIIVREVSILKGKHEFNKIIGLFILSTKTVFLSSFIVFSVSMAVFWKFGNASLLLPLLFSLLMLPFISINSIQQAVIRGCNKVLRSQAPEMILNPLLLISIIGSGALVGFHFTHKGVLLLHLLITIVISLVLFRMVTLLYPAIKPINPSRQELQSLAKSILPFTLIGAMSIINGRADVVMIGVIDSTESAGIYNIATNGADLISFMLVAVNIVLAPIIARLYSQKEIFNLETILRKASKVAVIATLPILAIFAFAGGWLLDLFGPRFIDGQHALIILSIGQLVNAGAGSVALLLNMSGHEKNTAIGFGMAAIGNVILNIILIPEFGINGAAIATFTSTSVWNILLLRSVIVKFNINPSIAGKRIQIG